MARLWCDGCDDGLIFAVKYQSARWIVYPPEEIVDWLKVHADHKGGFDLVFAPFRFSPPREPDA